MPRQPKLFGDYLIEQVHRNDAIGDISRKLVELSKQNQFELPKDRDRLSMIAQERFELSPWNVIDDFYWDEYFSGPYGVNALAGYVYVIQHEKHYKIGVSKNVSKRITAMKTNTPVNIQLVHSFFVGIEVYANAYGWEKLLHHYFASRRLNGEWFNLTKEDVQWIMRITSDFIEKEGTSIPANINILEQRLTSYYKDLEVFHQRSHHWIGKKVSLVDGSVGKVKHVDQWVATGLYVTINRITYWVDESDCTIMV